MSRRRMSSRRVALTATFLTLAAGGVAACDGTPRDEEVDGGSTYVQRESGTLDEEETAVDVGEETAVAVEDVEEEAGDEVFYCADEDGEIVDAENCDDVSDGGLFFLWHSAGYPRNLAPGTMLDGGDYFRPGDRESRKAFKLPENGRVANGTVKTNVVGRGSGGATDTGSSGG